MCKGQARFVRIGHRVINTAHIVLICLDKPDFERHPRASIRTVDGWDFSFTGDEALAVHALFGGDEARRP